MFWPGEFQRLYSPWDCKETNTTERLSLSLLLVISRSSSNSRTYSFPQWRFLYIGKIAFFLKRAKPKSFEVNNGRENFHMKREVGLGSPHHCPLKLPFLFVRFLLMTSRQNHHKAGRIEGGCYSALSFNTRSFPHLAMTPHIGCSLMLKELTFGFFPLSTVKILDEKMDWSRTQCSQGPCLDGAVGLPTDWLLLGRCPSLRNPVVPHMFVIWNKSFKNNLFLYTSKTFLVTLS